MTAYHVMWVTRGHHQKRIELSPDSDYKELYALVVSL